MIQITQKKLDCKQTYKERMTIIVSGMLAYKNRFCFIFGDFSFILGYFRFYNRRRFRFRFRFQHRLNILCNFPTCLFMFLFIYLLI